MEVWASQAMQWYRIRLPVQEMQVRSLGWEELLEKETATHSRLLPWESRGQRSLTGYRASWGTVHGVAESQTRLSERASTHAHGLESEASSSRATVLQRGASWAS